MYAWFLDMRGGKVVKAPCDAWIYVDAFDIEP
jgi:hypothetical protein